MNLPEFTQFVQLMNWQNNSCEFLLKIAQSISKWITCIREAVWIVDVVGLPNTLVALVGA